MINYNTLEDGDILITKRNLLGVYGFTCHPSESYETLKLNLITLDPDKICVYAGEYWLGKWNWASDHDVSEFVFIIHDAKVCWVCLKWLQKYR